MKKLLLLLVSGLMGIFLVPDMLTAADSFEVQAVSFNAVETVPLPEPEPEPVYEYTTPASEPVYEYVAPAPLILNYTVTAYVGTAREFNNIATNLSYSDIYKFKNLIYAHNSPNLLGSLATRSIGDTITITEGAVVTPYRVSAVVYYNKTADGSLEGDPSLMTSIAKTAMGHSIALMTCAGTPYGNDDASQRLVIYADAI